jgi:hypothetical protein
MPESIFIFSLSILLILYGIKSIISGIKNENRSYFFSIGYDDLHKLLKDKYNKITNIALGIISVLFGVISLVLYF